MDDTPKTAKGACFCSCFGGFRTRHKDSFLLDIISKYHFKYHFERNFVYISIFKNGPKYAPMVVRFGRFYFNYFAKWGNLGLLGFP